MTVRRAGRRRRRVATAVAAALAVGAETPLVRAADSWSLSIGIRETGSASAIGSDGGTTGGIEWINLDGFTINADDAWHTATWNFAPGLHTATNFNGGNGILSAANNKGVLEHIRIRNTGGNSGGEIRLRIDDVVNTVGGVPTTITGFEGINPSTTVTPNDTVMFREPIFSNSTRANMSTGANGTLISTASANSGAQSLAARWTYVPNGDTNQWLRLTTNNAEQFGNPIVDIGPTSSLSIAFRMSVYNPTGTRVRGIDASQFQGTGHDWVKAAAPMSAGGGGLSFAFLRATRGGTSGTSATGAMRVDDPNYTANITGAKAAGLLTGPYHFGRPDMWTPNDATGLGNAANSAGTPEDEARHYLQVAGNVMKPGYMRPVYDLEDGNEELNNTQLTNFVLRFNDTLKKYKGPAAQIIVYAGTSYANSVNEPLSQFPLWMPRFQVESDWAAGDVFATESSYGVWGDSDPGTTLQPWSFWQYYSPDVYIPGINAGTHNDIDVAHGDINYVRQYLVQGAIWDGSPGVFWGTGANWSTNAAPTASTEVLLDAGTPSSIVVTAGSHASGIYFADNYTLGGGSLSLNDGRIDVDVSKTATISTNLSTPNGFRKVGLGVFDHSGGTSTMTGVAQVLQGTMNVSGGSIAVSGNLMVNPELTQFDKSLVEPFPASASEITSSTLTINGGAMTALAAYVGGTDTAAGAIGTLDVSSGSLAVTGLLKIWNSSVPMVDSKVNLTGGTLAVGALDTNGDVASFNWDAGTFAVTGAGGLSVATGGPIGAALTVGTSKQLIVFNALTVDASSTVTLQNGGVMTVGSLDVGGVQSRFTWTGGTFTINGPGVTDLGTRTIGVGGTPMILNINGGSVTNTSLIVGALSAGTLNHTGGTHTVAGALNVGVGGPFPGTHNVSGTATLNANGGLNVGGNAGSPGGTGILNISGGTTTTPTLKIWNTGAAAPGGTRVNLTGGTLAVGSIDLTANPARFNFAGGTLNHNGPGTSDLGGVTVGSLATLNINGGTVSGPVGNTPITIASGGVLRVHAAGTLAARTENDGFLVLNGGTVTAAVHNNETGTLQATSSDPSVFGPAATVDNAGIIDVLSSANVTFSAGVAGPGTINVAAGASATTVVFASGALHVDGAMAVAPGWPQANLAGDITVAGRLDLTDNKLIVLAGGGGGIGTHDGTSYSGLTGRVASAYNFGAWDGNGIATSMPDAQANKGITTIAIATADEVFYAGGTFGGVPVNSGDVLLMYTYAGDVNLDGLVDGADYGTLDNWIQFPGTSGYANGDVNYDGVIDGADYGTLDNSIQLQGDPFPSGTYPAFAARVAAVPEPAACGFAMLGAGVLVTRRGRRKRG